MAFELLHDLQRLTGMLRARLYSADRVHFDVDSEAIVRYQAVICGDSLSRRCTKPVVSHSKLHNSIAMVKPKKTLQLHYI